MSRRTASALVLAAFSVVALALPAPAEQVMGGRPASEPYKFMVSLQRAGGNGNHFCGGSLVHKLWVLTAAHCVEDTDPKTLQVMMGSHELSDPGKVFKVAEVIVHEQYTGGGYDIALLRLAKPSPYPIIQIATVDQKDLWAPDTQSRAIGWGSSIFLVGPRSNGLNEVDLTVVSDEDCALTNGTYGFDPTTEVCAGETLGMKDTCQGDSGGPLMVPDEDGDWVQMGTVSWGIGCGVPMHYGVYGRVGDDPLRNWLDDHLPNQ